MSVPANRDEPTSATAIEIRSYRAVFELDRRIYRIDRLRLNPSGVPLRGIVYFLALALVALLLCRLPLFGLIVQAMPWYVRDLLLPGLAAAVLTVVELEGRPSHLAGLALLRYCTGTRELAGLTAFLARDRRWRMHELLMLPDGSDSRLRRLRYTGPGTVLVSAAHVRAEWDRRLPRGPGRTSVTIGPLHGRRRPARGRALALSAGARLEVHGDRAPRRESPSNARIARGHR